MPYKFNGGNMTNADIVKVNFRQLSIGILILLLTITSAFGMRGRGRYNDLGRYSADGSYRDGYGTTEEDLTFTATGNGNITPDVTFTGTADVYIDDVLDSSLTSGAEVAILEGVTTAYNSGRRTAGFNEAIAEAGLDVVAQQSAQWDQTKAVSVTSAILVQHPNLAAIFCANDNMALGALAAVNQASKSDQIKIIGFDNISAVQNLIKNRRILASVDQHADLLAVYGIETALEALSSQAAIADKSTPVDLITIDTLD